MEDDDSMSNTMQPRALGEEFSSYLKGRVASWVILLSTLALYAIGSLFVFSISAAEALDEFAPSLVYVAISKQLVFGLIALAAGYCLYRIGARRVLDATRSIYWLQLVLLAGVYVPGLGILRNGARRWIGVGGFLLQPSEFAKITVVLLAIVMTRHLTLSSHRVTWKEVIRPFIWTLPLLVLIVLQPDNRTAALTASALAIAFYFSPIKLRYWLIPLLVLASVSITVAWQLDYVKRRIAVYIDPSIDPYGRGYQPYQAKIAVGSGGLVGRGLGKSLQKFSYLPEAQNDYIAAIIAEETGFVGVMIILAIYATLLMNAFVVMSQAANLEMKRLAGALTYLFAMQLLINLCVVVGIFPSTGLNLPFISQGGTSLVANGAIIALLLSISHERSD